MSIGQPISGRTRISGTQLYSVPTERADLVLRVVDIYDQAGECLGQIEYVGLRRRDGIAGTNYGWRPVGSNRRHVLLAKAEAAGLLAQRSAKQAVNAR